MPQYPPNVPHFSGEVPTIMGVIGTLGTADTSGTSDVLPIGVNPATGGMYVHDLSSGTGTSNVLVLNQLITSPYKQIDATYPTGTTEQYVFSTSGVGTAGTILVTYSDSTKGTITSVVKTP